MKKLGMTTVIALLLGVSGCAALSPSTTSSTPPEERTSDLRTMIMPTGTSYDEALAFQINRAGYAAVFRIIPGQGAMMIYPRPGYGARDGFLYSGFHRVVTAGAGPSFVSTLNADAFPTMRAGGAGVEPEYYFVVVSERPLRLDGRMYGPGRWFQSAHGGPATMDWIVSQIVPDPRAADWTTDYYVHWPETISAAPTAGLIPLTCDGKRVWANPEQYDRAVSVLCGDGWSPQDPARPRPEPGDPGTGGDPVERVEPQRRDPVPAETTHPDRIVSRQLQEPEAWEQARSTLAERRRPAVAADPLPSVDPLSPGASTELERMLREAERARMMRDADGASVDPAGRMRPGMGPVDGDPTRPGFDSPRVRPTFEMPDPTTSPPPSFEAPAPAYEPPPPPPPAVPAERSPSEGNQAEGATRARPTVE